MFNGVTNSSIIILHEPVYLSLLTNQREIFKELNLKDQGITVRDDPAATKMYYSIL
jgi:hypothetical protein